MISLLVASAMLGSAPLAAALGTSGWLAPPSLTVRVAPGELSNHTAGGSGRSGVGARTHGHGPHALPGSPSLTEVGQTLFLPQNDLVAGNYLPPNGLGPDAAAVDAATGDLFVADEGSDNLSVLATSTGTLVAYLPVGASPDGVAVDAATGDVYVANQGSDNVSVIDGSTLATVASIPVGGSPQGIAYDPGNGQIYVANAASDNLSIIDGSLDSVVASPGVGVAPLGVAADPDNGLVYVANSGSDNVSVVDGALDQVDLSIGVGDDPTGVAVASSYGEVLVTNPLDGNVSVIDDSTNSVVNTFAAGVSPSALAFDPQTGLLYVANPPVNSLTVLYTGSGSFVTSAATGGSPAAVVIDPNSGDLYIPNYASDNVTVLDGSTTTWLASIPLGMVPTGVAYQPTLGELYVPNEDSGNVSIVDALTNRVVGSVDLGLDSEPVSATVDTLNGDIFVTDSGTDALTILDPFNPLPYAVVATIPVGSDPIDSIFDPSNGYVYVSNAGSANLSVVSPSTDSVVGTIPVGLGPIGLALGVANAVLYVANSGSANLSRVATGPNTALASLPVGSAPQYLAFDPSSGLLYVTNGLSSNVTVIDTNIDRAVASIGVGTFPEGIALDSANDLLYVANYGSDNVSVLNGTSLATAGSISVGIGPNGLALDTASGSVDVANEGSGSLSILSLSPPPPPPATYPVAFYALGLPAGTPWSVTLNGSSASTTSGEILFNETNATYLYTVPLLAGYEESPGTGSIVVDGAPPAPVDLTYSALPTYAGRTLSTLVLFNDSLLPGNFLPVADTEPYWVVTDPANGYVYVSDEGSGNLTVINSATGEALEAIPAGQEAQGLALDPADGDLYVADFATDRVSIVNTSTATIVGMVAVGEEPWGVAYDPSNGFVYVTNRDSDNVTVIGSGGTTVGSIPVGLDPAGIEYDAGNGLVYVANMLSDNVSVLDPATEQPLTSISVGIWPVGVAVDATTDEVYVTNSWYNGLNPSLSADSVSVIDTTTNRTVATIPVGEIPEGIAVDAAAGEVFVANSESNNVSVIATATLTVRHTLPVGSLPTGIAFDPLNGVVYTANFGSLNVTAIATNPLGVVGAIATAILPGALAVDPADGNLFVANGAPLASSVEVVNESTDQIVAQVPTGVEPGGIVQGIAVDPDNGEVYVANTLSDSVTVIAGTTLQVVATVAVGGYPSGIAVDPATGDVFVTDRDSNELSVIDGTTNTLSTTITSPAFDLPGGIAFDPANGLLYVANQAGGNVEVVNAASGVPLGTIGVGSGPIAVAADPARGYVLVANAGSANVSVINASRGAVAASVNVGIDPYNLAVNGSSGLVFVGNLVSDNVTVVDEAYLRTIASVSVGPDPYGMAVGASYVYVGSLGGGSLSQVAVPAPTEYAVTFGSPGGSAPGTWSVTLGNQTLSSPRSSITFHVPNGTYAYTIVAPAGYTVYPVSGTLTVDGAAVAQSVAFTAIGGGSYTVTFEENGLPLGTTWRITLAGTTGSSTGPAIAIADLPNGTFAWNASEVAGYAPSPGSGTVTVRGGDAEVGVGFSRVLYALVFAESGLPSETAWALAVSGTVHGSSSDQITLEEPNGSYPYSVAEVPGFTVGGGAAGTADLDGAGVTVTLTFSATRYPLTFEESGLPASTSWSVTLTSGCLESCAATSSTGSVAFLVTNGSYGFSIGGPAGYATAGPTGTVTIDGFPGTLFVPFAPTLYSVTFTESGLPPGTVWGVVLGGAFEVASGSAVLFRQANTTGPLAYQVAAPSGYAADPSSGTVSVSGANLSVPIEMSAVHTDYAVLFTQSGLPAGTSWTVTLGAPCVAGCSATTTTATAILHQPNGTYPWSVSAIPGFSGVRSGLVVVAGQESSIGVRLAASTYALEFTASGLVGSPAWAVSLSSPSGAYFEATTGSSLTFQVVNGTWQYLVGVPAGYTAGSGEVVVSGTPGAPTTITFSPLPSRAPALGTPLLLGGALLAGIAGPFVRRGRTPTRGRTLSRNVSFGPEDAERTIPERYRGSPPAAQD